MTTQKELYDRAGNILLRYRIGEIINGDDDSFLRELILRHPDAKTKIGAGIINFFIGQDNYYGKKCFCIRRKDGTHTDFSYRKCVDQKNFTAMELFNKSCRAAIDADIFKARNDYLKEHPDVDPKTLHVHHTGLQFHLIILAFIDLFNLNPETLEYTDGDNKTITEFKDLGLREQFRNYHTQFAYLKVIPIEDHKQEHKLRPGYAQLD